MRTEIPADGTKAAVRYWAKRTRESLRLAEEAMQGGDFDSAEDFATQAAGEAGEYENAMRNLGMRAEVSR